MAPNADTRQPEDRDKLVGAWRVEASLRLLQSGFLAGCHSTYWAVQQHPAAVLVISRRSVMHYNVIIPIPHQLAQILKLQMALSYSINIRVTMATGLTLFTWSILEKRTITFPFTV